jgi:hypothetical protein
MQVDRVSNAEWDVFNDLYGTIFSTTKWLDIICDYNIYGIFKGQEMVGGFVSCGSLDIKLTIYHGVILKDNEYAVMKAIAEIPNLKLMNHYSITDVRPFLWKGYKPTLRYTYIVDKLNPDKDTRYEINKAERNGFTVRKGTIDEFWDIYQETFDRKNLELPVDYEWMKKFNELFNPTVYICGGSGAVIMSDSHRDYYIFGATKESALNTGASSLVLSKAITRETDLVGCNNEKIGLFKKGFGGVLKCITGLD